MMQSNEPLYTATESGEEKPCPPSPEPKDFDIPKEFEDYYKLPKSRIEPLEVELKAKIADADEKKKASLAAARERKRAAEDACEAAKLKSEDDQILLDTKIKNKKTRIRNDYRKSLRETLPKNYCAPGDKDIEEDDKVPKAQKAIKIAEMRQKLAVEELEYLKQVQEIRRNLSRAGNDWKLAQEQYEADNCIAEATEYKEIRDAHVAWRTAINQALEEANP